MVYALISIHVALAQVIEVVQMVSVFYKLSSNIARKVYRQTDQRAFPNWLTWSRGRGRGFKLVTHHCGHCCDDHDYREAQNQIHPIRSTNVIRINKEE